jgi:2-dehydro-3-deoxyphosphogluconate aldolase/(4S)-4-hydroxy-2-oxoglutarate aldolase
MDKEINKENTLQRLRTLGLLAVLRGPAPDTTVKMVEALVAGGVKGIEITFTTPDALAVVRRLDAHFGEAILLGMGTLTDPRHAQQAAAAGARYLVSPMVDDALARAMVDTGLLVMMGALTPTEVMRAYRLGSDVIKIFPGSLVGPRYLKSLHGPFPGVPLMPTGGVSRDNVADWFAAGAVAVGAGSSLCPKHLALEGRFEEITAIAADFVEAVSLARRSA